MLKLKPKQEQAIHFLQEYFQTCRSRGGTTILELHNCGHTGTHLMNRWVLNGGSAYGPYDVNRISLTSDLMPVALLSDPMIRLTPILVIGVVFRIYDVIIDVALSHHQSRCIAVTRYVPVLYIHVPLYAIHHFASSFHSTITSNNLSLKGKSRVFMW